MRHRLRNLFDQYQQKENHLTNSLLVVLNHNQGLLKSILKEYGIRLSAKRLNLLSQVAPKRLEGRESIPDGYIYTDDFDFCVGIETKIEPNSVKKKQLLLHLRQLEEYNHFRLLVLTPDNKEPEVVKGIRGFNKNITFISWVNLLDKLAKIGPDKSKNPVGQFLFNEFMAFMERQYKMTPFAGINFRDGYDNDLAAHYIKRISEILTPEIVKLYPTCINRRPKIFTGQMGPWEAWYSASQVQNSVHPGFGIHPEDLQCGIVLPNGCRSEWKKFHEVIVSDKLNRRFKTHLKTLVEKAPKGAETQLTITQRHYLGRTTPVLDAKSEISVATLLGIEKSKENIIWWDLLREISKSKPKYNYQLTINYKLKYDNVSELKSKKVPNILLKCFRNLKSIYNLLNRL